MAPDAPTFGTLDATEGADAAAIAHRVDGVVEFKRQRIVGIEAPRDAD